MILCERLHLKLQGNKYFTISNNEHTVPSSGRKADLPVIHNSLRKIIQQKRTFLITSITFKKQHLKCGI